MSVVAVDLAAKYSAAVCLDADGSLVGDLDSTGGEEKFIDEVMFLVRYAGADHLVVEDLPHGVGYRALVKRVCQLQGRFADRMFQLGRLDQLRFVAPNTWRGRYPPLRCRGAGMDAVVPIAVELGYEPPALLDLKGPRGGLGLAKKVQTDYCAAYLIAAWAQQTLADVGHLDVPGTARYGQPSIKKDSR